MTQGLTFYLKSDSVYSLQVHQKRPGCKTCDNTFIGLSEYLFPFLFTRDASSNDITSFTVKDTDDNVIETLSNDFVKILNAGDTDYIFCSFQSSGVQLECGIYYYELTLGTEVYYSELFNVIDKSIDLNAEDISVNGEFETDLSGWTVDGAVWDSGGGGRAQLVVGDSISQSAPGTSLVKIVVNTIASFTQGMEFSFGAYTFDLAVGENIFYVPSGITYTIRNNDTVNGDDLFVTSVQIYSIYKVSCYNLIFTRNSCNKNNIPYISSGYADVFIFDGELAEPKYLRQDEFGEDGNKAKTQTFLKIQKRWSIKSTQSLFEPFVDELNKIPANDIIYIFNDIWKKPFSVYQQTLDMDIEVEWLHEDKCDASVILNINEAIVNASACCEEIQDMECCTDFIYDFDAVSTGPDTADITITIPDGNCAGLIYKLLTYNDGDLVSTEIFTDSITYSEDGTDLITHQLVGSKFGCEDIVYTSLS